MAENEQDNDEYEASDWKEGTDFDEETVDETHNAVIKEDDNLEGGKPNIYIEAKSGHWIGYYEQYSERHWFSINLCFEADRVSGDGDDEISLFSINGPFDPLTGEISFTKYYHGQHTVEYTGHVTPDGYTMTGEYSVGEYTGDVFRMTFNAN